MCAYRSLVHVSTIAPGREDSHCLAQMSSDAFCQVSRHVNYQVHSAANGFTAKMKPVLTSVMIRRNKVDIAFLKAQGRTTRYLHQRLDAIQIGSRSRGKGVEVLH